MQDDLRVSHKRCLKEQLEMVELARHAHESGRAEVVKEFLERIEGALKQELQKSKKVLAEFDATYRR